MTRFKRTICLIATVFLCFSHALPVFAHGRDGHNSELEYVLFGKRDYKSTHPIVKDEIQAIEDATYLCVDQYNGKGVEELKNLNDRGVEGIPKSIDEIDFTGNYAHRKFTHRGWNVNYPKRAHWPERQSILLCTVKHELFEGDSTALSWFPWLEEKVFGDNGHEEVCESFSMLLYNVHIIGDHIEAGDESKGEKTADQKIRALAYVDPLTRPNDKDNPGIIPDLKSCLQVLFESQQRSRTYIRLMNALKKYERLSNSLVSSTGGVNTEEEFIEYNQCANDLLETLSQYVPSLLKNEEYFSAAFY